MRLSSSTRWRLMRSRANDCSARARVKPAFTAVAISCLRVNSGVRYVPPGRSESLGAAAPVLL
jgi:hypothetical protein